MTRDAKKIFKLASLSALLLFMLIYTFFQTRDLMFGVKIRDVNIRDGIKVEGSVFEVTGNARNAVKLYLDGREISIDQAGNFKETIALSKGYNRVNIRAEDKFGNTDEKDYQLIY